MLTLHVLNVGHGSSIVVEFDSGNGRHFGVIDSNTPPNVASPKALTKLKQLGATKLAFVALTHPHADHLRGLYSIILGYRGAIQQFYSCPFGELLQNRDRLAKLKAGISKILKRSDGMEQRMAAIEFGQILSWADSGAQSKSLEWFECRGDDFAIAPPGFSDVKLSTILPPARAMGTYVNRIMKSDMSVLGHFEDNEISLAFRFSYGGKVVVLGGDGTAANWEMRRRFEKNRKDPIAGNAVNLPHHGSKHDCKPDVLTQLFCSDGRRIAVTSANGQSHPHLEVIEWLKKNSIQPYCTNLMPACGANAQRLLTLPNLEPRLARWVREVADNAGQIQVCQGDVKITIAPDGTLDVIPEVQNACGYRGDFDSLFAV